VYPDRVLGAGVSRCQPSSPDQTVVTNQLSVVALVHQCNRRTGGDGRIDRNVAIVAINVTTMTVEKIHDQPGPGS
jgi:hypothetical protein